MERNMNTLYLTSKLFAYVWAYVGLFLGIDQEVFNSKFITALNISPMLTNFIVIIAVFFWIVKIIWFIYDKFFLERTERLKKLKEM
jgi:hypothetical protein